MKLNKLIKFPLIQLSLYIVFIAVISALFFKSAKPSLIAQATKDTFANDDISNKVFNIDDIDSKSRVNGQLTVEGDNNRIGGSWLPHDNGNIYMRPGKDGAKGKIYLGDQQADGVEIGSTPNVKYNRIGEHTFIPHADGNAYIRPGQANKEIRIGDWWTGGTRLGTGGDVKFNQVGPHTWLPFSDGNSYIRPGKDNSSIVIGDMWTNDIWIGEDQKSQPNSESKRKTNINMRGKMFFNQNFHNSDTYSLEKVWHGNNKSSLRMTINDDADEAFDIFGNSCAVEGGCYGAGKAGHRFRADGSAMHRQQICVGEINDGDSMDTSGLACLSKQNVRDLKKLINA